MQPETEIAALGLRALRATWRMAMQPEDLVLVARLLAGLPRRAHDPSPPLRLAAAGRELIDLRRFLDRARDLARERQLPFASLRQEEIFEELPGRLGELVERIERCIGPFPERGPRTRRSAVRQTYLVDVDPEEHASAHWMADLAHQASGAPTPTEALGPMTLRAIAADLREVERFLVELRAAPRLRRVAAQVATGCGALAGAIEVALPPAVGSPTPSRAASH